MAGTDDRPWRPPSGESEEDNRIAMVRLNQRLEAALARLAIIEQVLVDNGLS